MLPDSAIILCYSEEEAERLLGFLDSEGAYWPVDGNNKGLCIEHLEHTFHCYDDSPGKQLCYNLNADHTVCYCHERWYRTHLRKYGNHFDDRFNFCTVDEFIEMCEGVPHEIDLDMLLELV